MPEEHVLVDNRLGVETPEGVEFELELAGLAPRIGAYGIDLLLRGGALFSVVTAASILASDAVMGLFLIFYFVIMWGYYPLFEALWEGQSPGKKALGIAVVNRDGTPVGWFGAVVRNLLRVGDLLPFGYVVGVTSMVVSGRFQRLGDLAGDTVVVYRREAFGLDGYRGLVEAEPVQVSVALSPQEQEAIVEYSERSPALGKARAEELAMILEPLTAATGGEESAKKLYGVAARIVKWG